MNKNDIRRILRESVNGSDKIIVLAGNQIRWFLNKMESLEPTQEDRNLLDAFSELSKTTYGYIHNNKVVGMLDLQQKKNYLHLELLYVDPVFRKLNVGKKLVQFAIDRAPTNIITTNPHTDSSENFFKHLGFTPDDYFDDDDPNTMVFYKS